MGPYRIVGRLGAGGMGIVYAGVDAAGQRAAVKLIHVKHAASQEFRTRFRREVAMLRRVQGACCVRILADDTEADQPWLATEYIAGRNLDTHVDVHGPLSGDGLFGLAAGLAEALVAVHAAAVVHRDLKPSNVMLSPAGPRLVDFGIARALDGTTLTGTGVVIGSPGWLSPEEYFGNPSGPPADVYGWALVVVFAATGRQPYGTGRPEALAYRVMHNAVDTSTVPEGLRPTVDRALAKEPGARPSMDEVLAVVAEVWRDQQGGPEPETLDPAADVTDRLERVWSYPAGETAWPSNPSRPRRRRIAPVLATVTAVGCTGVILLNVLPDSTEQRPPAPAATSTPTVQAPATPTPTAPPPAPRNARDLAAALDLALNQRPAAEFSFEGGFTQSAVSAKASGRLLSRDFRYGDDFEIAVDPNDAPNGRYVIVEGDLYVGDRASDKSLLEEAAGDPSWYALLVAGPAGPSSIRSMVLSTERLNRKGRTYSGVLDTDKTSGRLEALFGSWWEANMGEGNDNSYVSYQLTIDADNRPTKFSLVWNVPISDGTTYESEFTTTYSDWKEFGEISPPAG